MLLLVDFRLLRRFGPLDLVVDYFLHKITVLAMIRCGRSFLIDASRGDSLFDFRASEGLSGLSAGLNVDDA